MHTRVLNRKRSFGGGGGTHPSLFDCEGAQVSDKMDRVVSLEYSSLDVKAVDNLKVEVNTSEPMIKLD